VEHINDLNAPPPFPAGAWTKFMIAFYDQYSEAASDGCHDLLSDFYMLIEQPNEAHSDWSKSQL
jgi:hypothetical protein